MDHSNQRADSTGTDIHREHYSRAHRHADKKQWTAAIREMCSAVALEPQFKNSKSDLLKWVRLNGDSEDSRRALQLIAEYDRGFTGLQAVELALEWAGKARTLEERTSRILALFNIKARELALLRGSSSADDRLEFLAQRERLDQARSTLLNLSTEQRKELSKRAIQALIKAFSRHSRARELRTLIGDADHLLRHSKLATALAYALVIEGECDDAIDLLSPFDVKEYTSRAFQTLLHCAEFRGDENAVVAVINDWLRYRPNDALPNKRRLMELAKVNPSAAAEELSNRLGEIDFQARDFAHLIEAVVGNAPTAALQIAQLATSRFPDDKRLKTKLEQIATRLAVGQAERHERLKEQVLNELSTGLIGIVGADELISCGGASALHKVIIDSTFDENKESLLILARLCLSSMRVIVTRRDHKSRETRELHEAGSANWQEFEKKLLSTATLTRGICLAAILTGEDYTKVLAILAELQAIILEDSDLSRKLCCLALAEAEAGTPPSPDIWTVALSCNDQNLHACFATLIGAPQGKIMRWAEAASEEVRSLPTRMIHQARRFKKTIDVFASGVRGEISATIATRAEVMTEAAQATVYDGHLVSFDQETLWTLTSAGFVPPRRSSVLLHSGSQAAAIKPRLSEEEITDPVLLVPGVPACFSQYFHFAGQLLPRILARLRNLDAMGLNVRVALPDFRAPFIMDMLELCGVPRERVVLIPSAKTVRFTCAWVVNPSLDDWQCAPEDIEVARQTLASPTAARRGRRLYLSRPLGSVRARGRTITNEGELVEVAEDLGFEVVDPGSMTQRDQRELFGEVDVLCGPVGAAMTNILYMPPSSKVVCIGPLENTATFYPGLTLEQDISFTWVLGNYDPAFVNSRRFPHLPYSVRRSDFQQALELACAAT